MAVDQAGPHVRAFFDWLAGCGDDAVLSVKAPHAAVNIVGTPVLWAIDRTDKGVVEDVVTSRELAADTPSRREPVAHVHVAEPAGGWDSARYVRLVERLVPFHPHVTHRVALLGSPDQELIAWFIGCGRTPTLQLRTQIEGTGLGLVD